MENLSQEIAELKGLLAELHKDRQLTKEREHSERWTRFTSISIVVIAVLTAFSTLWVGKYSTRTLAALNDATFHQVKASDEWSYYQAKSIKQNLYEATRDQTQAMSPQPGASEERLLADIASRVARYEADRQEIKAKAERLERQRDEARQLANAIALKSGGVQIVVALLQIAIALCSIALVAKLRRLWEVALILATGATIYLGLNFFS